MKSLGSLEIKMDALNKLILRSSEPSEKLNFYGKSVKGISKLCNTGSRNTFEFPSRVNLSGPSFFRT